MQYIKRERSGGCPFCIEPDPEIELTGLIVARGKTVFAVLNRFPYNTGHVLILPYRHLGDLSDLAAAELSEIGQFCQRSVVALKAAYRPTGFNLGANLGSAAGAGIPGHLHYHVVPRFAGDTNFMPILGQTKVLPEELPATVEKLRDCWPQR